ncbi:N-acetyl-gamma-glutamyl-phosphate reductase [Evansella tamaricis]|uniref:N-acetyl-gamma-glutamyl-phosphate reductase n=1 Tax=Evansella tamaricis TaxID=2069301 RepID=A0ABS6JKB2_9BACI|nr:N-acetyl-gamma-glutamyl-phosphate reductase [Evansella tamaricis]MBU9714026.1 N-acetyl-gamma-glutamyl-phosphate reductase [Evansella tamaricis]
MKAAIIGGTGYGAVELIRLLDKHPFAELVSVISHSQGGKGIEEVYPHLSDISKIQMDVFDIQKLNEVEVVFFATPAGVSKELIPECYRKGIRCIDLSGDFRLNNPANYEKWYKNSAVSSLYLDKAIYGLSEIYGEEIRDSKIIANPGCYPTATLLALIPIIRKGWLDVNTIIIDGKSGVSGAGRSISLQTHYSEINENVKAYKLGKHQHIPEIEQNIQKESKGFIEELDPKVTFTTHLVPMTRGIMCTIYGQLNDDSISADKVVEEYQSFYQDHPFVRVRPYGTWPSTKEVAGSNYCDIGIHLDSRTGRITFISVIDNLMKGAAGQAIQNLNIINGWDVRTGLLDIPVYP